MKKMKKKNTKEKEKGVTRPHPDGGLTISRNI